MSLIDEFMRKEKYTNPELPEELKNELLFEFDNFKNPAVKEKYHALAKSILNLMLLEPGTYADAPEMGINISQYQFEFLNSETLSEIQISIRTQVDRYIPSNNIQKIAVMQNTNKVTGKKELIVGFAVGSIDEQGNYFTENFWIRLANNEINGTVTQILY